MLQPYVQVIVTILSRGTTTEILESPTLSCEVLKYFMYDNSVYNNKQSLNIYNNKADATNLQGNSHHFICVVIQVSKSVAYKQVIVVLLHHIKSEYVIVNGSGRV
jgi:hypothetical protein